MYFGNGDKAEIQNYTVHIESYLLNDAVSDDIWWPRHIISAGDDGNQRTTHKSQPWHFRVTWRHQSRDHSNPNRPFPTFLGLPCFEIFGGNSFSVRYPMVFLRL